ncbi:unnamed protein product [Spirodela intermedia]|uniref:Aminotransferase class I/classII large domain-containing protein n=1 Tax=Spirodela intermedia TaxID=51605 RepID=A0A7I8JU40_SPIIN|nr:unnamed protein product [Spirodela intermedia]CAA6672972.1 unnamed protein product [Spirodela intermedia]
MAENGMERKPWRFDFNPKLRDASSRNIRSTVDLLLSNIDRSDARPVIPLGHGDPSSFPSFRTTAVAEAAVVSAVRSGEYNCYGGSRNLVPSRRLSLPLPGSPLSANSDDVFLTMGCLHAIETVISVLARPGANILLPRPCYPFYEVRAQFSGIEVRYFDLLPDRGWEIDLDAVETLADDRTAAMVIINPGNPTGSVLSYGHLEKVAETARKLGIMIIADEVYGHLVFGNNPFVPMGVFGSVVPVLTIGSISKRWAVPGWRLGWIAACDPNGILKDAQIVKYTNEYLSITSEPVTFIQGAIPEIIKNTTQDFFDKMISLLRQTGSMCYDRVLEMGCFHCRHKAEGSMFMLVRPDPEPLFLKGSSSEMLHITDDVDFCCKLAKEESLIILPGSTVGLPNWLRITFAVEPSSLEDGLLRLKAFCGRHAKGGK